MRKSRFLFTLSFLLLLSTSNFSCTSINLYEQTIAIPAHRWHSNFIPQFAFVIADTADRYDFSITIRHRDLYHYNNIWLEVALQSPDGKQYRFKTEKQLGTNQAGWLGTGMDDVYEHRISLLNELIENQVSFRKKGKYTVSVKQIMREDPLEQVLNVGLRVEKRH
ncbi:MAG: gliding motility lipoprotein GldH [Bacteroidetes bacterium]|nr:gliding motility lipoprotein GldH [Bacteroidota bacterium]